MIGLGRRLLLGTVVGTMAAVTLIAAPSTAEAHTRTEETTNVESRITSDPGLDGVSWTVHTGGLLIEVTNRSDEVLLIHGYDGEPYLRIGPEGVEENRRSPATYLNRDRYERTTLPPVVDVTAPPEWQHVHDEPRVVWHDHRTHWMSPQPPRFVDTNPVLRALMGMELVGPVGAAHDEAGVFTEWSVPVTYGGQDGQLEGELVWIDAPTPWPWLLLGALLVAPGFVGLRHRDPHLRIRAAAFVVLSVASINAIHLADDLLAFPSDPLDEVFGLLHTTIFLVSGAAGAIWALRVRSVPLLALGIGSGAVLYHQGLVHLPMLFASQFPTMWPDGLVRTTVALGLAQAIVVTIVIRSTLRAASLTTPGPAPSEDGDAGTFAEAPRGALPLGQPPVASDPDAAPKEGSHLANNVRADR